MDNLGKWILVKGDISGIQEFIFNVKSKGAAKTLKARSFFIDAIGILAVEYLKDVFKKSENIYNGGGNIYIKIPFENWSDDDFKTAKNYFLEFFNHINISLNLSCIEYQDKNEYGKTIASLNRKVNEYKLSKHNKNELLFEEFNKIDFNDQFNYKLFSENLTRNRFYKVEDSTYVAYPDLVGKNSITLFNKRLVLTNNQGDTKIVSKLPLWTNKLINKTDLCANSEAEYKPQINTIIDFGFFSEFAKKRTGTGKIAALKLDIDNLGNLFQNVNEEECNKFLSKSIAAFFINNLENLISQEFAYNKIKTDYKGEIISKTTIWNRNSKHLSIKKNEIVSVYEKYEDNLYVVFAGGDDCFIIGAWDVIIDFAVLLKKEFDIYEKQIRRKLQIKNPITFSAAILIVDHHFPIVKIADYVEERLHQAKSQYIDTSKFDATGLPLKNKISFLNKVFTWEEFVELRRIKDMFVEMILKYGEERAFLQRIQQIFENIDQVYWIKNDKPYDPSVLWRFKYHFRDIRKENYFHKYFYNGFFEGNGLYNREIFDKYNIKFTNSQKLPVAARWAELLTK